LSLQIEVKHCFFVDVVPLVVVVDMVVVVVVRVVVLVVEVVVVVVLVVNGHSSHPLQNDSWHAVNQPPTIPEQIGALNCVS
jgi:hypothetical protein